MKKVFKGNRYNFKIFNLPLGKRQSVFYIKAKHKETSRTSFITNVNIILSELNIPLNNLTFEESEWVLSKKRAKELTLAAERFLSDKEVLPYVEEYLDLDRDQSEWENYE